MLLIVAIIVVRCVVEQAHQLGRNITNFSLGLHPMSWISSEQAQKERMDELIVMSVFIYCINGQHTALTASAEFFFIVI